MEVKTKSCVPLSGPPLSELGAGSRIPVVGLVIGAFAVGYGTGMVIDHYTGASDYIGEALYDAFPSWFDDEGTCPQPSQ